MTPAERAWQLANALCARALSGGTVQMATMTTILSEALQAAEAEAYQRGVEQEREACARLADQLKKDYEEQMVPEIEWAAEYLAEKIRARGTP